MTTNLLNVLNIDYIFFIINMRLDIKSKIKKKKHIHPKTDKQMLGKQIFN